MTKPEEMEDQLIETIDEDGNVVKFELIDIVDFEDKEYGLLLPQDEKVMKKRKSFSCAFPKRAKNTYLR